MTREINETIKPIFIENGFQKLRYPVSESSQIKILNVNKTSVLVFLSTFLVHSKQLHKDFRLSNTRKQPTM